MAVGSILLVAGCKVDTINTNDIADEYNRSYDLAAPLLSVNATAEGLFGELDSKNFISHYDDGLIYGFYQTDVELGLPKLLSFPTQSADLSVPALLAPYYSTISGQSSVTAKLKLNDKTSVRYDSMYFYKGMLDYQITVPANTTGTLTITFPELTNSNHQALQISKPITANQTAYSGSQDLSQYEAIFSQGVDSSYIRAVTTINFTTQPSNSASSFEFHFSISQVEPEVVFGYFGQREIDHAVPTLNFDFFDKDKLGDAVQFGDLRLNIISENNIGVPFSVAIQNIVVENTKTQQSQTLTFSDSDVRSLNAADYNQPNKSVVDTLQLSKANSNVMDIAQLYPNTGSCSVISSINPNGTNATNFISRNSKLLTHLEIEFPLWFRISDYRRTDTIDFDLNDILGSDTQVDRVKSLKIYLENSNGFPFDIQNQLYPATANYQAVDSLFTGLQSICKACKTKSNFKLDEPTTNTVIAELDKTQIKKMRDNDVKYLLLSSRAFTPSTTNPQEYIKIFTDNFMKMTIKVEVVGESQNN